VCQRDDKEDYARTVPTQRSPPSWASVCFSRVEEAAHIKLIGGQSLELARVHGESSESSSGFAKQLRISVVTSCECAYQRQRNTLRGEQRS